MQHVALFPPPTAYITARRRAASLTTSTDKITIELPASPPRSIGNSKRFFARMSTIPSLVLHQIKRKPTRLPPIETSRNEHKSTRLHLPRTKRPRILIPSTPVSPVDFLQYEIKDAKAPSFTITLMDSPSAPDHPFFSFTPSQSSPELYEPPKDSLAFQLPPPLPKGERVESMQTSPLISARRSSFDINSDQWFGPMTITDDAGDELSATGETEDWRLFHVHFLQDDLPFLDTPV